MILTIEERRLISLKKEKIEETKELYEQNISTMDAEAYTKQSITLFGINVSVARGCPALWDGLAPVIRKMLWNMYHDYNLLPDKRRKKAIEFIYTTAKYHPHGDMSLAKSFENVTKEWENNVPYIDMSGNEGSVTGDDAASLRYLDARLSLYSYKCFFEDFDPTIIEVGDNYLRSDYEPVVLPSKYPNFLINTTTGIGWGNSFVKMPFNLIEAFNLTKALLDNPDMENVYLFPDSPRGYDVIDNGKIVDVCAKGAGTINIRARLTYHEDGHYIHVTGFPERTTMDSIIAAINHREKTNPLGIKDTADKSDLETTQFWIRLKKGVDPNYVIHELYRDSKIKLTYYAQILLNYADRTKMISDEGAISLKDAILAWIEWARVLKHRTLSHKLVSLQETAHKLAALIRLKEDGMLDSIFEIVKTSESDAEIIDRIRKKHGLSSYQAEVISNLQIKHQKKASLADYQTQYDKTLKNIDSIMKVLSSKKRLDDLIRKDLDEGIKLFGKPRACRIIQPADIKVPVISYRIVVTTKYVKRLSATGTGSGFLEPGDMVVSYLTKVPATGYLNIGTDLGEWCYLPVDMIPTTDASSKGTELATLVKCQGLAITAILTSAPKIRTHREQYRLYCFTTKGLIKVSPLTSFKLTKTKIGAITLNDGDKVCYMDILKDNDAERLIYTKQGKGIILDLATAKSIGRLGKGQRIIQLDDSDEVQGLCISNGITELCIITKKGYGKIVALDDAFYMSKRKQTMLELTRMVNGDEVLCVYPITREFYNETLVFVMQSGSKSEILTTDIRTAARHAKPFKIAPVRRGDSIIRIKIKE